MKAAVFHGPHQPLTIENVDIDKPIGREVLVRAVASGVCHSDLHFVDGFYPFPDARHPRPRGGRDRRGGGPPGVGIQAGRPRHRLPLRVLRPVRLLPHRQDPPLPDPPRPRQARAAEALVEGPARQPVRQPLRVRGEDARPRERPREDRRRDAARSRGAHRLRGDDGRRGRAQHRADRGGLHRRRLRRRAASGSRRSRARVSPGPA